MSIKNNWLFTTTKKTRLDALEQISIIFLIEHTVSSNLLDISEPDHRWRLEEDGSQPYIWQKKMTLQVTVLHFVCSYLI